MRDNNQCLLINIKQCLKNIEQMTYKTGIKSTSTVIPEYSFGVGAQEILSVGYFVSCEIKFK